MATSLVPTLPDSRPTAIVPLEPLPADRHPAAVYRARLGRGSQRTMCHALDSIASAVGVDVGTVKDLAGHANVPTTLRDDRRGEVAKRKAMGMIRVPDAGRRKS